MPSIRSVALVSLALGAAGLPVLAAPTDFIRPPAVHLVTDHSAVIDLEVRPGAGAASVRYGRSPDHLDAVAAAVRWGAGQTFKLERLAAGQTLYYRVDVGGRPGGVRPFQTAGGAAQPLKLVVWGDSRPNDGDAQPRVFHDLVALAVEQKPDLAVTVGDNVQFLSKHSSDWITPAVAKRRYDGFLAALDPLAASVPVYFGLGNHERPVFGPALAAWRQAASYPPNDARDCYYAWDRGPAHFVMLSTEEVDTVSGARMSAAQLDWLKRDLEASHAPFKFVFGHRPLFGGIHKNDFEHANVPQRDLLHRLFLKTHVTGVIMSHDHLYQHAVHDGLDYVITGGAGSPLDILRKPDSHRKDVKNVYHLMVLDIALGQPVRYHVIDPNGYPVDHFKQANFVPQRPKTRTQAPTP